jgi:hypothetical protein
MWHTACKKVSDPNGAKVLFSSKSNVEEMGSVTARNSAAGVKFTHKL